VILGWARFLLGQWPESGTHLHLAHDLVEEHGGRFQRWAFVIILPYALGNLAMASGRLDEAREIFERGLAQAQFHSPIWLNHGLAQCQWMLGDTAAARASMERSMHARDRFRCIICGCQANGVAAEFYATLGDVDRAEVLAREAEDTAVEIGHVTTHIRVLRARAQLGLLRGTPDRAVELAQQAVALGRSMPLLQPYELGQSLLVLGSVQRAAGEPDRAAASWQEARSVFGRLGAAWHLRQVEGAIAQSGITA
jgi:tetratricopeptide (TPR) repeat protein